MRKFNIEKFISNFITKRSSSLFSDDISINSNLLLKEIKGKNILVIGGAGTIGSSFIKSVLKFFPKKIVVVDINENGLTELTRDLRSSIDLDVPEDFFTYPMNFSDDVFFKMFDFHKPFDIVANFAAHKHVRSEKDRFSIESMINNNVIKAKSLMDLLVKNKPKHFFCVSTDKAAKPVNLMGATKKLMEDVIMAYSSKINIKTARFANVAFSNGSLLDGYFRRISKNQPIACPSDIKRFFVSPAESGQICMLACILGKSGDIFFPKLSIDHLISFKQITIDFFKEINLKIKICNSEDEAKKSIISFSNNNLFPVYFFETNTSGEKLYEEFYSENDLLDLDSYKSLGVIKNAKIISTKQLDMYLRHISNVLKSKKSTKIEVVNIFENFISDFNHHETGKNLDQKM